MRHATEFYLGLGTLLFTTAAAVLVIAEPFSAGRKSGPVFEISATDYEDRIRVDWDPATVKGADSATLRVRDGDSSQEYPVNKRALQIGGLDYLRRSEDVFLTLTVHDSNGPEMEAFVRRTAPAANQNP